jgi:parallel beta-helix repeat protein
MPYEIRKTTAAVGLFLILFVVFVVAVKIVVMAPNTIVVPNDYSTIQAAVDAASEGDIIYVKHGKYKETLVIDKALSLTGEDEETTVINGYNAGPVILIRHDNVNVKGFTLLNGDSPDSTVHPIWNWGGMRLSAVHILSASYCTVTGNKLANSGCGVWLYDAHHNTISGNSIAHNDYGIRVDGSTGNVIRGNTVTNSYGGINLLSSDNTLKNNILANNTLNFGVSAFYNVVDDSNTVDGKPIYYWVNQHDKIVPSYAGCVVLVNCTNIKVQELTLARNYHGIILAYTQESTVINNNLTNINKGVYLHNSQNDSIFGNEMAYISGSGNGTKIIGNNITSGITVSGSYQTITQNTVDRKGGIALSCSGYYNNISSNNVGGTDGGVSIDGPFNNVYGNTITADGRLYGGLSVNSNTTVERNTIIGTVLIDGSFNIFSVNNISNNVVIKGNSNTFYGNYLQGVVFGDTITDASNNIFYHNNFNFVRSGEGKRTFAVWEGVHGTEILDNGKEGNYWSDYTGKDANGNGIGDTPYVIHTKDPINYQNIADFNIADLVLTDHYPLMAPIEFFDAGTWEGTSYNVSVISDSNLSDFSFNPEGTISFLVEGEAGTTGFCRVTVPKDLLHTDGNWIVLVDGESVTPTVNEDTINSYIYFTYAYSTKTVEIIGTDAIPEFPSWTLLPLLLAATLLAITYKKKLHKTTIHRSY